MNKKTILVIDDDIDLVEIIRVTLENENYEVIDAHTDALVLLDRFVPGELNVIIDAAEMGLEPGSVAAFRPDEVRLKIKSDHLSMHGFGLGETFAMAEQLGTMPDNVLIVGVQPARIEINQGLSEPVAAAVPRIISLIEAEATE